jgi:hypothetical protein
MVGHALHCVNLRMLWVAHLHGLLTLGGVIVMVSMPGPVMMGRSASSARFMPVITHVALTFLALGPPALPILPHGLYTESAVVVSRTSRPPTA